MAFLPYPPTTVESAIAVLKQDVQIVHDVVHGDNITNVDTESGLVPSFSKLVKTLTDEVEAATGVDTSLRSDLANVNSNTSISGVPAKVLGVIGQGYVTPEQFGAVGDGVTDDTVSINNWLLSGKPLSLLKLATYRLTSEINIPNRPVIIVGLGRLPVYAYEFSSFTNAVKLPTFLIDHNGSDAFRFRQNSSARGSYFYGFNIIRKSGATCTRAFGFDVSGTVSNGSLYGYDCTFERLAIFDFISAFDMYVGTTTIEPTMADITIKDCVINRNDWIVRNLNGTAWNMFRFIDNKAGQQNLGGLDISAHSVIERGNLLEGMPNPIKISGAYEGANLGASYFEANNGTALYNLQALRGPVTVNPCTILANSTNTIIYAGNVSELTSSHPVVGEACYNISAPNLDGSVNSMVEVDPLSLGISLCSQFDEKMIKQPRLLKSLGLYRATVSQARGVNPLNGTAMVVESLSTLAGATSKTINLSSSAYDYVVITFMLKHNTVTPASTYVTVDINGTGAAGSRDYNFGEEDLHISKGDWKVYTIAVKPQVAVSSIVLRFYPYGTAAATGLSFELSGITAYSALSINSVKPFINKLALNSVSATPTTGSWLVGDELKNITVANGGQANFVYTSGGWVYG